MTKNNSFSEIMHKYPLLSDALTVDSSISFLELVTIIGDRETVRALVGELVELKAAIVSQYGITIAPQHLRDLRTP